MHRFVNPHIKKIRRSLVDVFLWKTGYYDDDELNSSPEPVPESFVFPLPSFSLDARSPQAVWINHSTFLISIEGIHILTDPIWSKRCSPLPFLGPKRRHVPSLDLSDLSPIDYVLISHNHYDHLDKKTVLDLVHLFPEIVWLVPLGVKQWFARLGITKVIERGWWEESVLGQEIKATAVPSQHFSGRRGRDLNHTLWVGWVMEFGQKKLYFAGDTGYNAYDFKKMGQRWKKMDLSLLPIGSYLPRKFMSPVHVEPKDAVKIHQEVGSLLSIGGHWKTFRLSDEPWNRPPYDLFLALKEEEIDPSSFLVLDPGHAINW